MLGILMCYIMSNSWSLASYLQFIGLDVATAIRIVSPPRLKQIGRAKRRILRPDQGRRTRHPDSSRVTHNPRSQWKPPSRPDCDKSLIWFLSRRSAQRRQTNGRKGKESHFNECFNLAAVPVQRGASYQRWMGPPSSTPLPLGCAAELQWRYPLYMTLEIEGSASSS